MTKTQSFVAAFTVSILLGSYLALAQNPPAPPQPMSFFVTSAGGGKGADLGGLAGADQHCQTLAAAAGRGGATWHAYLSTQGAGAVNARDRIGSGPWYNAKGARVAQNVADLHGDTLEAARLGNALGKQSALTEKGEIVNGVGDTPNRHDMLTGSQPDGRAYTDAADHTCQNWTRQRRRHGATRPFRPQRRREHLVELRRTRAAAAARRTWSPRAAPACTTASPRIETDVRFSRDHGVTALGR